MGGDLLPVVTNPFLKFNALISTNKIDGKISAFETET